jgi:hypothetical protein
MRSAVPAEDGAGDQNAALESGDGDGELNEQPDPGPPVQPDSDAA